MNDHASTLADKLAKLIERAGYGISDNLRQALAEEFDNCNEVANDFGTDPAEEVANFIAALNDATARF